MIRVMVTGAVQDKGWKDLPAGATVQEALDAAGGWVFSKQGRAAGRVTLRRPFGYRLGKLYGVATWDSSGANLSDWASYELQDRDGVVFAWEFDEKVDSSEGPIVETGVEFKDLGE